MNSSIGWLDKASLLTWVGNLNVFAFLNSQHTKRGAGLRDRGSIISWLRGKHFSYLQFK